MALTSDEIIELSRLLDARMGRDPKAMTKAEAKVFALRTIARDPIMRRKQFKIVPGAALSKEAARLAQFYEQARPEQRAALDMFMCLFSGGGTS